MADTTPLLAQRNAAASNDPAAPRAALDDTFLFTQAGNCMARARRAMAGDGADDYQEAAQQLETAACALRALSIARRFGLGGAA